MNSNGKAENMHRTMAVVHNLLAPLTERFSLRIRAPPRTMPSTAMGIPTPPERQKSRRQKLESHGILTSVNGFYFESPPTDHHVGEGDGLSELPLDELGHEGGEARKQRGQVDLSQNHQQVDGTPQCAQGDARKTCRTGGHLKGQFTQIGSVSATELQQGLFVQRGSDLSRV